MLLNRKKTINELKENLIEGLGKGLHSLVLYGPVARGEAVEKSDIDILMVVESAEVYERASDMVYEVDLKNRCFTSIFWATPGELERYLERGSPFLENVSEEGVILFDDGTFEGIRRRFAKAGRPGT